MAHFFSKPKQTPWLKKTDLLYTRKWIVVQIWIWYNKDVSARENRNKIQINQLF